MIQIDAESAVGRGTLLFFIPGINMEEFVADWLKDARARTKIWASHLSTDIDRYDSVVRKL
jgi:hypothetical protein